MGYNTIKYYSYHYAMLYDCAKVYMSNADKSYMNATEDTMQYSLTIHNDHYRVYIYSLNKVIRLAKDIVITGELITKLELALRGK